MMVFLVYVFIVTNLVRSSQQLERLEESDTCYNSDRVKGVCKRLDKCTTGSAAIKAGKPPKICSFMNDHPIICCPPESSYPSSESTQSQWERPNKSTSRPPSNSGWGSQSSNQGWGSNRPSTQGWGSQSSNNNQGWGSNQPSNQGWGNNRPSNQGWGNNQESNQGWGNNRPSNQGWGSQPSKPTSTSTDLNAAIKIAKQKCKEYGKTVIVEVDSPVLIEGSSEKDVIDNCGRVEEPLIVGGQDAKAREYPHMALIGYRERNPEWLCGGSLISERYVISAAHCSNPGVKGPAMWAKLGELDTSTESEDASPQIIRIISRVNHPEYSAVTLYNDVALFKLERNVVFDAFVRPICLATQREIKWKTALATGWGHTSWGGSGSSTLMKVRLNLVNTDQCNTTYKSSIGRQIPQGIRGESMVCAGNEVGKDTCQGDSGGPLQIPIDEPYCMYELIGVTSFGKFCATGSPGIYTRVSHFLPWIVKNIWPN